MLNMIARLNARDIESHKDSLVELLRDVVDGGASVNFLAPLTPAVAAAYWDRVSAAVAAQTTILQAAMDAQHGVIGSVQLVLALQPNGPHRAEVQKLLVHSRWRRRGIATALMEAIEQEAQNHGRWLLVLDSERGTVAERHFYEHQGYTRIGVIPEFALSSVGNLADTVLFYKKLS